MQYSDGAGLDGLQQVVDRLAGKLGRSVAVDDARGRLVVASRHFGEEDALRVYAIVHRVSDPRVIAHFTAAGIYSWTEPGRIPANHKLEFKARICCPIRDHDILFGHLFLIDEGVRDWEIGEAVAATVHIGELMYRRLVRREEERRRAEEYVRDAVSGDPFARRRARESADADADLATADAVRALVLRTTPGPKATPEEHRTPVLGAVDAALGDRFRGLGPAWATPAETVVLLHGRATEHARDLADGLVKRLDARRAVAGLGSILAWKDAASSCEEARLAVRAAQVLPELGPVATHDGLGVYGLLLRLPPDDVTRIGYPAGLRRLLDADHTDLLVDTLESYLDRGGDITGTAAQLCVHRSTLYYRIGRIEDIAGVDLRDGSERLALHLGLKLRRLLAAL